MKHTISISIDQELIPEIEKILQEEGTFRNKSHVVEFALQELLKEKNITE